ncbi:MAG: GerMN domain-containing protein [Candidatus Ratteibacteria bacterium]
MGKKEKVVIYFLISVFILLIIILGLWEFKEKYIRETSIYIFLTRQEDNKIIVEPVRRKIKFNNKIENKIENTMKELIKGPTEQEKEKGFSTCLNENTKILNVYIEGDILNLDFSKEVEEGGGTLLMQARIAQIVCTGTQFPEIKKIRFLIEGNPIKYFSGEGITIVEEPVSRDALKEFEIEIREEEKI